MIEIEKYISQVIISVDSGVEVDEWEMWLDQNKDQVELSENTGYGCCVDIFDVIGNKEILETIPKIISSDPKPLNLNKWKYTFPKSLE